jgi:ABC-type uncharacterized transport system permease subunit
MSTRTQHILRLLSLTFLLAGLALGACTIAGFCYLGRGTYNPLDALVVIVVSVMACACPILLVCAAILFAIQLIGSLVSR